MSNIENIKQLIEKKGMDFLVGEFIGVDELQEVLSDIGYKKGNIDAKDNLWYSNVISNFNGYLSDFRTISPDNEEYRIIINSLSGTEMVEAVEQL